MHNLFPLMRESVRVLGERADLKPSCIHRVAMFLSPSCCASCETLFHTPFSLFMISMVSNDLHSGPWYPSRQSLSFYNHSLFFFKSSGSPSFQFCSILQDLLSPYLFPFWPALAFGHLASFLQKLRPSISLFRTLLVPPIISVRTLYQQVMPECVDSASSHSVHSSVVVLGRGHTQLLTLKPFQTGFACMFFCSLHHFSASTVSFARLVLLPRCAKFQMFLQPKPSIGVQNRRQACLIWVVSASPPSDRSVPFHPVVPMASLAGGIRRVKQTTSHHMRCICRVSTFSKMLCSFVEGHVPPRSHVSLF